MDFSNDLLLCKHHIQKVHSSIFLYLVLYDYMQVWPNYQHDYIITWVNLNDSFPANTHTRTIWHVFSFSFTTFNPGFPSGLDLLHFRLWSTPCSLPPPTDCGLLSLDRKKTTMATVGWWIKALIGKGESLWLRTRMYSTRTRSDSVTRFKKKKKCKPWGRCLFPLCDGVGICLNSHTDTHTCSIKLSLTQLRRWKQTWSPLPGPALQYLQSADTEFSPCSSIIDVNQHRVEPLHIHYPLINPLIIKIFCSIVAENICSGSRRHVPTLRVCTQASKARMCSLSGGACVWVCTI